MYAGPGVGPMLSAAAAWNLLAAELRSAAISFEWSVASLLTQGWWGPSASAMTAAAEPYISWMSITAEQAEQTAAQAYAAADAYASAYAMTVPPPAIADNRVMLSALVKTNALGLNTPAIAATESRYAQMWAQDAVAMYSYAAASATATELVPFAVAPETTSSDEESSSGALPADTGDAHSQVPSALRSMASPAEGARPTDPDWHWTKFFDGLFDGTWGHDDGSGLNINAQLWNTIAATGIFDPGGNVEGFAGLATLGFWPAAWMAARPPSLVAGSAPRRVSHWRRPRPPAALPELRSAAQVPRCRPEWAERPWSDPCPRHRTGERLSRQLRRVPEQPAAGRSTRTAGR